MESSRSNRIITVIEESSTVNTTHIKRNEETIDEYNNSSDKVPESDFMEAEILDHIKSSSAIFQSQQKGDPELTITEKRKIAEDLFHKSPGNFLLKFGEFLREEHLNYFLNKFSTSYEIMYYVKNLKNLLNDHTKKIIKRNRRYEAMKKMEAEGNYFSEIEMEKREPLLYHQMVGQYLSEKEKLLKNRDVHEYVIPSFSTFLINKMEREEMNQLVKTQQEEEDEMANTESSSEEELTSQYQQQERWGEDWDDKKLKKKIKKKQLRKKNIDISAKEKNLLLQEFLSIMKNNFLNGKDADFNYSEVDSNPEYDSVDLQAQDEEEKYFDEETYDASVCTDTGIEDY